MLWRDLQGQDFGGGIGVLGECPGRQFMKPGVPGVSQALIFRWPIPRESSRACEPLFW